MKVAMFGTFDIGNFGDILFPIVAERKLALLGEITLDRYSYRAKSAEVWCYDVLPIQTFPARAAEYDLVLVGGGHLVHFARMMAEGYLPTDPMIPHPLGFWWLPAVAGAAMGVPVATHGISCDSKFPDWAEPLLAAFVDSADYLTVRDDRSRQRLEDRNRTGKGIEIVPDSVFSISDIITPGQTSATFEGFRREVGLKSEYIIAQPSYSLRMVKDDVLRIASEAKARGLQVLELPIGFEIGNDIGFYDDAQGFVRVNEWPEPLLLAEIIANAQAVIGISLHLSIVASAYGIPVFRTVYTPQSKFNLLDVFPNVRFLGRGEPFRALNDAAPDLTVAHAARDQLEIHWHRLRELGQNRNQRVPRPGYWEMLCRIPAAFERNASWRDRAAALRVSARAQRGHTLRSIKRKLRKYRK